MSKVGNDGVEFPPPEGIEPALHRAARLGDHAEIRRLVAAGADVNAVFTWPNLPNWINTPATPLMIAAGSNDGASVETVRLLVELGADPKVVIGQHSAAYFALVGDGWGRDPGGDAARARLLLELGSPLPTVAVCVNHLLCDTAGRGCADRMELLLKAGRGANLQPDPEQDTRLAAIRAETKERDLVDPEAPWRRDPEVAELLGPLYEAIESSMSRAIRDSVLSQPLHMETPLSRAARSGSVATVRLLLAAGADPKVKLFAGRTVMFDAASVEVVEELRRAGLRLEERDESGMTPLGDAACEGGYAAARVRAFVAAGADVNATCRGGLTVFLHAVSSGETYPELLRMLIAAGADPHVLGEHGGNAFHQAIDAADEESARDTLAYLNKLGVDIEHRDQSGHTPLARALECGVLAEVQALCDLGADPNAVCPQGSCDVECSVAHLPLLFHATHSMCLQQSARAEILLKAGAHPLAKSGDGLTAFESMARLLCEEAADPSDAFQRLAAGLERVEFGGKELLRDEFVARVRPRIRAYVEEFAASIPIRPGPGQRILRQIREEQIDTLSLLRAYESWARHKVRAQPSGVPDEPPSPESTALRSIAPAELGQQAKHLNVQPHQRDQNRKSRVPLIGLGAAVLDRLLHQLQVHHEPERRKAHHQDTKADAHGPG